MIDQFAKNSLDPIVKSSLVGILLYFQYGSIPEKRYFIKHKYSSALYPAINDDRFTKTENIDKYFYFHIVIHNEGRYAQIFKEQNENQEDNMLNKKIEVLLNKQKDIDKLIYANNINGCATWTDEEKLIRLIQCMQQEVSELMNETNFRYWRENKNLNKEDFIKELADVFIFILAILNTTKTPLDDFLDVVYCKQINNVNKVYKIKNGDK